MQRQGARRAPRRSWGLGGRRPPYTARSAVALRALCRLHGPGIGGKGGFCAP